MTLVRCSYFFFQAEDGIRDLTVTGVQTCALPICRPSDRQSRYAISSATRVGGLYRARLSPITRIAALRVFRSEERRVGKSVDLGGRRIIKKKKKSKVLFVTFLTIKSYVRDSTRCL